MILSVLDGVENPDIEGVEEFWVIEIGVGECVDSVILVMQLLVLRQELNKERPYTPFHLMFNIYLAVLSTVRLIFAFLSIGQETTSVFVSIGFYLAFLINSVLLLGYWVAKRQELP